MAFDAAVAARSTVILIQGTDTTKRTEALHSLLASVHADEAEIEQYLHQIGGHQLWLDAALTMPFLADRRVFVVRNIGRTEFKKSSEEEFDKNHTIVKAMRAIPESSLVILVADDELGDSDKQKSITQSVATWIKLVGLAGGKAYKFDFNPGETPGVIQKKAKEHGRVISSRAANTLSQMVSGRPMVALEEFEKVLLYVDIGEEIRESHIQKIVIPDVDYNVYQMVDAVVDGQPARVVAQMRTLFGQGTDILGQTLARVFPTVLSSLRFIWQARFCLDVGIDPARPGENYSHWLPDKRLATEPDWRVRKSIQSARKLSLGQLESCLKILVDSEAELKGQRANFSTNETVERTLLKMCEVCSIR